MEFIKCYECFFTTNKVLEIKRHLTLKQHRGYKCENCEQSFPSHYKLNCHHKINHTSELKFATFNGWDDLSAYSLVCHLCNFSIHNIEQMKLHHIEKHDKTLELNIYLIKSTANVKTLLTSSKKDDVDDKTYYYQCKYCNINLTNLEELKVHINKKHSGKKILFTISSEPNGLSLEENSLPKYYCVDCSKYTLTFNEARVHYFKSHDKKIEFCYIFVDSCPKLQFPDCYDCTKCLVLPNTYDKLVVHWDEMHPGCPLKIRKLYPSKRVVKTLHCKDCNEVFYFGIHLSLHQKYEHTAIKKSLPKKDNSKLQLKKQSKKTEQNISSNSQQRNSSKETKPAEMPSHIQESKYENKNQQQEFVLPQITSVRSLKREVNSLHPTLNLSDAPIDAKPFDLLPPQVNDNKPKPTSESPACSTLFNNPSGGSKRPHTFKDVELKKLRFDIAVDKERVFVPYSSLAMIANLQPVVVLNNILPNRLLEECLREETCLDD